MKINQAQMQNALGVYRRELAGQPKPSGSKAAAAPEQTAKPADAVELSPEAKDIAALKHRLTEVPAERQERVAELTQQVKSGTYQVPAKKIAQHVLDLGL
ncbi:MAG: flagellar biosynthesis anti-sigma factor FlgM [Symbiobacteriia bacterium]